MTEGPSIQRVIDAGREPATVASLTRDLHGLGVQRGEVLLVHSSLSSLGYVVGGAETVVHALFDALGPEGTLVMPTFSSARSDPAPWRHPPVPEAWWDLMRETMPAYDPLTTPTRMIGAIAEVFRTCRGTLRSAHPVSSFAARGPLASAIVGEHGLAYGLGETSPLARLYEHDARVLLLGVGHANNSSLHLAEYRATGIGAQTIKSGAPMTVDGARQWVVYDELDLEDGDFPSLGDSFGKEGEAEIRGAVAMASCRLFSQRALVDYAVGWLEAHRSPAG